MLGRDSSRPVHGRHECRPYVLYCSQDCLSVRHCERSEAIQVNPDCFVTSFLAMTKRNMQTAVKGAGGVMNELVGDVVRFPVWWYTTGVVYTATTLMRSVRYYARSLGIAVWIRNIFVPMFGQRDWQSRTISILVRSAQIFFRGIAVCMWTFVASIIFVVYIALPLVAVAFLFYHLTAGVFGLYA